MLKTFSKLADLVPKHNLDPKPLLIFLFSYGD